MLSCSYDGTIISSIIELLLLLNFFLQIVSMSWKLSSDVINSYLTGQASKRNMEKILFLRPFPLDYSDFMPNML